MNARITAIEFHLPEQALSNAELSSEFNEWTAEKIEAKTGIVERRIAAPGECSSDLGVKAAEKLFHRGICGPEDIDFVLFCSQSPDYLIPTTACLVQQRLGISTSAGALDFNLGCSGYIYGLGIAKGLIETRQAHRVLLITAETYSRFIHPQDRSLRSIFGDAAAATLVEGKEGASGIGPFLYGTDGSGAENLIVPTGGTRRKFVANAPLLADDSGNKRTVNNMYMNGAEIFSFTLRVVPESVETLLKKAALSLTDVKLFVFHQANLFMLEHLRKKIKIPKDKFYVYLATCGNTVSSTIPIALHNAVNEGLVKRGDTLMLVGFGVGYSWGAALVNW